MILSEKIQSLYDSLLTASYPTNGVDVPVRILRHYVNLTSYEYTHTIKRFLGNSHKVLLVGDAGGRDYYFLKLAGMDVTVCDIAEQSHPGMVQADITDLPFAPEVFDGVVLAEVIEHVVEDFKALTEIRRVLKGNGIMVLTVPFYHDEPEYHVRIHSPATIERLLRASGFAIQEYREKGGGFTFFERFRGYAWLVHGINWIAYRARGRTYYDRWNGLLTRVDLAFGSQRGSLWHRYSRHYGAFIRCVKANAWDFRALNRRKFREDGSPLSESVKTD
jgi:SAM-dependent methyltransferase